MTRKEAIAKFIEILDAIELEKRWLSFTAHGKPLSDGKIHLMIEVRETLQ